MVYVGEVKKLYNFFYRHWGAKPAWPQHVLDYFEIVERNGFEPAGIQRPIPPDQHAQNQPVPQPAAQYLAEPVAQYVAQPVAQPVAEPVAQYVAQPVAQPAVPGVFIPIDEAEYNRLVEILENQQKTIDANRQLIQKNNDLISKLQNQRSNQ